MRETGGACGDETSNRERPPSFGHWCGMGEGKKLAQVGMVELAEVLGCPRQVVEKDPGAARERRGEHPSYVR